MMEQLKQLCKLISVCIIIVNNANMPEDEAIFSRRLKTLFLNENIPDKSINLIIDRLKVGDVK